MNVKNITKEQWQNQLALDKNAIILDVRTPSECLDGIQEGAEICDFLNREVFLEKIGELDKSKHYYVYCRSGNRSRQACDIMNKMGVVKTYNLIGGMMQWDGKVV